MLQANLTKAFLVLVTASVLAGCGANPSAPDVPYDPNAGGGYVDPGFGGGGGYTPPSTPNYGNLPVAPPMPVSPPMATVTSKKNGVFLGIGKFKCTVEVTNPADVAQSGTLTVTFQNGKKASKTAPISQRITLQARETQTLNFEDKAWSTDAVIAEFVADPTPAAATSPYGAAAASPYGAAPAAGGATGAFPSSPYGY